MKYNTLFLDRDGVINRKINKGYVTSIDEFEFLPNVLEALAILAKKFTNIFIVTNQQGIGKNIFSMEKLIEIHEFMMEKIAQNGGKIDKIYIAPNLESENHIHRKPNPGMAWLAQKDFEKIDFKQSIMVGDSLSDIEFGKNAGMATALLGDEILSQSIVSDYYFSDLYDFATHGINSFEKN